MSALSKGLLGAFSGALQAKEGLYQQDRKYGMEVQKMEKQAELQERLAILRGDLEMNARKYTAGAQATENEKNREMERGRWEQQDEKEATREEKAAARQTAKSRLATIVHTVNSKLGLGKKFGEKEDDFSRSLDKGEAPSSESVVRSAEAAIVKIDEMLESGRITGEQAKQWSAAKQQIEVILSEYNRDAFASADAVDKMFTGFEELELPSIAPVPAQTGVNRKAPDALVRKHLQ